MLTDESGPRALTSWIAAAVVGGGERPLRLPIDRSTAQTPRLLNRDRRRLSSSPLGVYRRVRRVFLLLQASASIGVIKGLEAVFEGRLVTPLSVCEPPNLADAGTFLKYVVRPGVLQGKPGPRIATEFGVLYPGTTSDSHFGAGWAGIISQRWDWGTVHCNVQTQLNREQRADLFGLAASRAT